MIRIVFPYLFFVSLVSLAGGVLNVYRQFAIPAVTPVLLNVSIIGAALFLAPYCDPPIKALAWGVFIGGVAQLALQIRPLCEDRDAGTAALRLARRRRAPRAAGDGSRGDRRVGGADLGAHQHAARRFAGRRPDLVDHLCRPADGVSERAAGRRARHRAPAVAREIACRREAGRVLVAARLGIAARVHAGAAGGRRALDPGDPAHFDALPIRPLLGRRRAADAHRASRLQRRPARAHRRQDPGAGLLCAAGDVHSGEDRVRDGARVADARADPDAPDRPRGTDAVDVDRRLLQRGAPVLVPAQARHLHARGGLAAVPGEARHRAVRARRGAALDRRTGVVLARGVAVGEGRPPRRRMRRGRRRLFRCVVAAGFSARRLQSARHRRGRTRPAESKAIRRARQSVLPALRYGQRGFTQSA